MKRTVGVIHDGIHVLEIHRDQIILITRPATLKYAHPRGRELRDVADLEKVDVDTVLEQLEGKNDPHPMPSISSSRVARTSKIASSKFGTSKKQTSGGRELHEAVDLEKVNENTILEQPEQSIQIYAIDSSTSPFVEMLAAA